MKTLTLDYSKWRCGGDYKPNRLGKGSTALQNNEGYQCCLGQFSLQLNKKIQEEHILNRGTPGKVKKFIPLLMRGNIETRLTEKAVNINDDPDTTPEQKISLLRKLFKKKGFIIRVVNKLK